VTARAGATVTTRSEELATPAASRTRTITGEAPVELGEHTIDAAFDPRQPDGRPIQDYVNGGPPPAGTARIVSVAPRSIDALGSADSATDGSGATVIEVPGIAIVWATFALSQIVPAYTVT